MARARIGLTQRVEDLPARGERRDALDQRWLPLLARGGWIGVPIPNSLDDPARFVDDLELALVVLTGGNDLTTLPDPATGAPERDATEHALLDHLTATGRPVLGVCRGLQLMAARAGATLRRADGHVGAPHALEHTTPSRWPLRAGPVNSFHDWVVGAEGLGGGFEVLAVAPDQTVEAIAHTRLAQVGVMWHPERPLPDQQDLDLIAALLEAG